MNHSKVRARLSSFIERELSDAEQRKVAAHLDECSSCSEELAELQDAVRLLRGLPDPELPLAFAESVMARIRNGEAEPSGIFGWLGRLLDPMVLVPVALGLAAFVYIQGIEAAPLATPDSEPLVVAAAEPTPPMTTDPIPLAGVTGGSAPEGWLPIGTVGSAGTVAALEVNARRQARARRDLIRQMQRMQVLARSGRIDEAARMLRGANHPSSQRLAEHILAPHEITVVEASWSTR
ncbi:MAG: zf-HC2 domain-containing protein [Myxococcales bacterium]|nr:zf-HC2 domain-containing protein [Myxococcales bacterium]